MLIYPSYEFTYHAKEEYNPADFGYGLDEDHKGRLVENEELIFLAYGITDWLMVEGEAAYIQPRLIKSRDDLSAMPDTVRQTGPDLETQVRCRFLRETEGAPEVYGFFETDWPLQRPKALIGTTQWVFGLGVGAIKGFSWGGSPAFSRGRDARGRVSPTPALPVRPGPRPERADVAEQHRESSR